MDIKIIKEKDLELKFKKEADIVIREKNHLAPKVKEHSFGRRQGSNSINQSEYAGKAHGKDMVNPSQRTMRNVKAFSTVILKKKLQKEKVQIGILGKRRFTSNMSKLAGSALRKSGSAGLMQMDGGREVAQSMQVLHTAYKPTKALVRKMRYHKAQKELKIKQADNKISTKQIRQQRRKGNKQTFDQKQKQAVRQRKKHYGIRKLTSKYGSAGRKAKVAAKKEASAVMLKAVKYMATLLGPFFGLLCVVAMPVILIVVMFYCSPVAAFMPSPEEGAVTVREVLSSYYMEFNQKLDEHSGDNAAITYLHENAGEYTSNYMDTLMVYMVQYGTGDLGVVMDDTHRGYLKSVFDEMNSFENTSVTTTVKAGQSLGTVVTSGYCQCSICCGKWAGGPTASGAMPMANHTLAVDSKNPFVPMGTKVIMGGIEYVVEDIGPLEVNGVQFDVFIADHATATAWGHKSFEVFLADGDENEVTVIRTGNYVKNLNHSGSDSPQLAA